MKRYTRRFRISENTNFAHRLYSDKASGGMRAAVLAIMALIFALLISGQVHAGGVDDGGNVIIDVILPVAQVFIMFSLGQD